MYQIAQNFTLRLILSFTVCASLLLLPSVSLLSEASQGQSTGVVSNARPRHKKPEGILPDLEDVKNESYVERETPPPIPSTVRARRNEGKPWDGRRVGDPGTQQRPVDQPDEERQTRRAHARRRAFPPPLYEDQFIQNFFSLVLPRTPTYDETLYWNYLLRAGYNQNQTSLKLAAIELGKTLFESASYLARNRGAHDYVHDLYNTYLMREPDAGGWAYWEALVPSNGREYVRRGFEESGEFATLLATISLSGSPGPNPTSLITARVDPRNQPGNGMLSRDVSWSMPLLSLPGRNGLDLGLALSYSSMVWTHSGPYFYFDEDNGFPSPGFRLGFPTVQRKTFDAQTGKNAYLLITPGGHRVELRQTTTSTVYEAADSSYLQLTETGATLLVRSTDGTQLTFAEANGEYRCTQIKDRNGNYLSVNYNAQGQITTITDTLGRVITFNYDGNANLISITQAWNGQSHQWVSFGWSTRNMQYSFADAAVVGIKNGNTVPVLTQVALNDTSYFTFDYANSLQVSLIKKWFGPLERNSTSFAYETPSGDVPRLMSSSVSAMNWTGVNGLPAQVTTQYSVAGDGACVLTAPDGTVYKEYYGTGWQKGLTTLSEVWVGTDKKKWTTTAWTQDNTSVSYETNPRVTETNVYDNGGNRRRTTIDYGQYAQWGLPYMVSEYVADGSAEIRRTFTDYNLSQAYLDRRIIGLVSAVHLTDVGSFQGKVTYDYDDPNRLAPLPTPTPTGTPATATQHDTSYNTSLTARGNLTSVSQWDVTDINNTQKKLTSYTNYFVTGSPKSVTDPSPHTSSISYLDAFSDGVDRHTYAYPTTLTDADGNSSTVQYNFDLGATTRTQSPPPANQSQGAIQTMAYNSLGQLERVTTVNNGAYKRFWYGPNYVASYATVNTTNDELYAVAAVDGLGRVMGTASNHPGSSGGYSLVSIIYDQMGRVWQQSNPTEINSAWLVSGDDAAGIYYTQQTYDWKGRPLVTTNQDGTTKTAEYAGCDCAGGQVITLTDEGTVVNGVTKKRQQKIYTDVLNRTWKTEILNWDGTGPNGTAPNNTVYSTTVKTFNVRDQVTGITAYVGAQGSGTFQNTTITYDGYGRMHTKHVPEQSTGLVTTYDYNSDDTIQKITDARGASRTFSYNSRHLITSILYAVPVGSGIPAPSQVSFSYDAAGNRLLMIDGFGRQDYSYDQLSRLNDETRTFTVPADGIAYGQPAFNNAFKLAYQYNLAGQVTSMTDSSPTTTNYHGSTVSYTYDSLGRLHDVNGSGFANVSQYASGFTYRAWGGPKSFTYANGLTFERQYDPKLRISQYTIGNRTPNQQNGYAGPTVMKSDFNYYADNRIKYTHDNVDAKFDTAYTYDWSGHLVMGYSGSEAYDFFHGTNSGTPTGGYRQTYSHDAWNNLVAKVGNYWGYSDSYSATYNTQNRNVGWLYDVDGNVTNDTARDYTIDAGGQVVDQGDYNDGQMRQIFDGDGERLGSYQGWWSRPTFYATRVRYYLHSSVLDATVSVIMPDGLEYSGYVYANGEVIAQQEPGGYAPVEWVHHNPITGSYQLTDQDQWSRPQANFDPVGVDVGYSAPQPSGSFMVDGDEKGFLAISNAFASTHRCYFNGLETNCSLVLGMLGSGAGAIAPFQQAMSVVYHGQRTLATWHSYQDGYSGYVPVTARYIGNGELAYAGKDLPRGYYRTHPRVAETDLSRLNNTGDAESDLTRTDLLMLQEDAGVKSKPAPCSVQVSWASEIDDTGDRYGLPIFAEIHTPGRIGQVGDLTHGKVKGNLYNGGKWEVGQKIWSWTRMQFGEDGEMIDYEDKTHDDSPLPDHRLISRTTALFFDRPGLPKSNSLANLRNGEAKFNIMVYAQRGRHYCSASFHIWVSVVNGKPFLREVGGGLY